jgi:N-acetylmuramoyl-L-alanine amidase
MKRLILLSDSGHGEVLLNNNGELVYTTGAKKRFKFSDGEEALEGVINRRVEAFLLREWDALNRPFVDVSSGSLDIPLKIRTDLANQLFQAYKSDYVLFYLSIHSNAGGGTGVEVITSEGQNQSDPCATIIHDEISAEFPGLCYRTDPRDGDPDKEMKLWVTSQTLMPSVLVEFLFFDNPKDWELLKDDEILKRYAKALLRALIRIENLLNGI